MLADPGIETRKGGHDEAAGTVERHCLARRGTALDIVVELAIGTGERGLAPVELLGEDIEIARIIGDEALVDRVLVGADHDRAAGLAVGLRSIGGERRAQGVGNGYPTLVVDKADTVSLITPPAHHVALAPGKHDFSATNRDHRRDPDATACGESAPEVTWVYQPPYGVATGFLGIIGDFVGQCGRMRAIPR